MADDDNTRQEGALPDEPDDTPGDDARVEARTMPDRSDRVDATRPRSRRWLALALLPLLIVATAFVLDRAVHRDAALRGVRAGDQVLSGLDRDALRSVLGDWGEALGRAPLMLVLRDGEHVISGEQIGFALDVDAMVDDALRVGRDSGAAALTGWLGRLVEPQQIAVRASIDGDELDALIAQWEPSDIADPPFEGAIVVVDGQPVAQPPRAGYAVDSAAAREAVLAALRSNDAEGAVALPLVRRDPERGAAVVDAALAKARALLSAPLVLVADLPVDAFDEDDADAARTIDVVFGAEALAAALQSRLAASALEVIFDSAALEPALTEARAALERPPVDARFEISKKDQVSIVPSRAGRVIDAARVAEALLRAADDPARRAVFPIEAGAQPELTTDGAQALGIMGLVSKFTTTHPCCRPRVKNIHRIAELVDGVIVRPGETFSVNEHVGERTAKKGFVPAPTIVHGEMKDTLGGGVSQFATTIFNTAFYGGYEIVERQPHSYYFERYPMGHEATLSFPKPDVIFKNDSEAAILIRTIATPTSITVKFYGNNGGRTVKKHKSNLYDLTDPPIEYIADDQLEPDEEKVKARGRMGWSVNVSRVVVYQDGREKKEARAVTYLPRVRKLRVHSCKIPKGEDGYTGQKCPEPVEDEDGEAGEMGEVAAIVDELEAEPED